MKRKRYTEAQIAFALHQAESGTPVAEIVRKLRISEMTFYRWKKKIADLEEDRAILKKRWPSSRSAPNEVRLYGAVRLRV